MRSGVGSPSYASDAAFAAITGTFDADYPVDNLADTWAPSKVGRVTPSGAAAAFSAVLAADQTVRFAALVAHDLPSGATVRMRFYSDAALSVLVEDVAAAAIPDPVGGYVQTYPVLMSAAATVRGVRVDLAGLSGDAEIGALEIAGWWEWDNITAGANFGLKSGGDAIALVGGASAGGTGSLSRTYDGQVSYQDWTASDTGLDFQKAQGLARPFVFVEDYSDPTSWPRSCFLARNTDLPPMVAQFYDRDHFQFRLMEHRR